MTIRHYWVHYDEPAANHASATAATKDPEAPTPTIQAVQEAQAWEPLFHTLLDLIQPHRELYQSPSASSAAT